MNPPEYIEFEIVYQCEDGHEHTVTVDTVADIDDYAYEDADECRADYHCRKNARVDRIDLVTNFEGTQYE